MFILTLSIMLLSVAFLLFVNSLVQSGQTAELKNAESAVFAAFKDAYSEGGAYSGNPDGTDAESSVT